MPVAPGGVSDTLARALAQRLTQSLGQQFIVENRGGAAHAIGAAQVAKSAPDGYTLLLTEGTALIPGLYKSLPYDPEKDLVPMSGLITINQGVLINSAGAGQQRRRADRAREIETRGPELRQLRRGRTAQHGAAVEP